MTCPYRKRTSAHLEETKMAKQQISNLKMITKSGRDNIVKSCLNKMQDIDSIMDWMDKNFIVVSDEEFKQEQMRIARQKYNLFEDSTDGNAA